MQIRKNGILLATTRASVFIFNRLLNPAEHIQHNENEKYK